ncbi:hypothetical protein ACTXT7_004042 [Hymenolepis weldensis]
MKVVVSRLNRTKFSQPINECLSVKMQVSVLPDESLRHLHIRKPPPHPCMVDWDKRRQNLQVNKLPISGPKCNTPESCLLEKMVGIVVRMRKRVIINVRGGEQDEGGTYQNLKGEADIDADR